MNRELVEAAKAGLKAAWAPKGDGWCQRWVRLCVEKAHGKKFQKYMRATAAQTGRAFRKSPYAVTDNELQPGDLLYKLTGSGGAGHVGIYVGGGKVCENSSFHGTSDARGVRTLKQFGPIDVIVRLPEADAKPKPKPTAKPKPQRFYLQTPTGEVELKAAKIDGGKLVAPVADTLKAAGFKITERTDNRKRDGKFHARIEPVKSK